MATRFTLILYAPDAETANRAARAAFDRIAELERVFSTYRSDSEARRLCATAPVGKWVPISRDLWKVLRYARCVSESTDGAFDVTVGPVTRLWRQARRAKRLPKPEKIAAALQAVGYQYYEVDPSHPRVKLKRTNMRFDFGGIAKGYALDESLRVLNAHGVRQCLVNGGGDIAVADSPPTQSGWPVRLSSLETKQLGPEFILPSHHALATSGDLFQYLEVDGRRYSHLIDPRTGQAVEGRRQVTVLAPSGMEADAWASALSVVQPERAEALIAKRVGWGARVLAERNGEIREWMMGKLKQLLSPIACRQ